MLSSLNDFYNLVYQVEYTELCIYTDRVGIIKFLYFVYSLLSGMPPSQIQSLELHCMGLSFIICSPAGGL